MVKQMRMFHLVWLTHIVKMILKQLRMWFFALRGELASVLGREAAVNDYYVHLMNFWQMVEDRYETDVSDDIKSVCNGYAAGINKFLEDYPSNKNKAFSTCNSQRCSRRLFSPNAFDVWT